MATIRGFNALRFTPKAGDLSELACPPYDIVSEEERRAFLARNPRNIIRLELPKEGDNPYAQAGETLRGWLTEGYLRKDETPGLYIYEEVFESGGQRRSVKGLVCHVKLEEFDKGVVLPHENTLSKAKEDRFNLYCATGCHLSSVYSLYFDGDNTILPRIEALSADKPLAEFTGADGILHRVWKVDDADEIQRITASFADKKLYIADGHHRYETSLRYRDYLRAQKGPQPRDADYVLMTLVNIEHPGLLVLPTHRIVRGLESFDPAALPKLCEEFFDVALSSANALPQALREADERGEKAFGLCLPGAAYLLRLRDVSVMANVSPDQAQSLRELDVSILHTLILERLMGINRENMANQQNLTYTHEINECFQAVASGAANCAFLLNPTKVSEIAAVASDNEKMPQKSTYFYPKLITGHIMNQAEEL